MIPSYGPSEEQKQDYMNDEEMYQKSITEEIVGCLDEALDEPLPDVENAVDVAEGETLVQGLRETVVEEEVG